MQHVRIRISHMNILLTVGEKSQSNPLPTPGGGATLQVQVQGIKY